MLYANRFSNACTNMYKLVRAVIYFDFLQISTSFNFVILRCVLSHFFVHFFEFATKLNIQLDFPLETFALLLVSLATKWNSEATIAVTAGSDTIWHDQTRYASCRSSFVQLSSFFGTHAGKSRSRSRVQQRNSRAKRGCRVSLQLFQLVFSNSNSLLAVT